MSQDMMFTSLAQLAGTNTDDISVLRNRLQKEGIYLVDLTSLGLTEMESNDPSKPPMVMLKIEGLIADYYPLTKPGQDVDDDDDSASKLVGKQYRETYMLWMNDLAETLGLLKGRFVTSHLACTGIMGGVEGIEGWLDAAAGKRVAIRVTQRQVGDDTRVYYNALGMKALNKLGISWDEMGRDPVDAMGNPIEVIQPN